MIFTELLAEVQKLERQEKRAHSDDYFEIVIVRDSLDPLHKILTAYFGAPLKPEGDTPSGEANRRAKAHGGIRKDQAMYFRQDGDLAECVLLWPWGSGSRITVKIIRSRGTSDAPGFLSVLANFFRRK